MAFISGFMAAYMLIMSVFTLVSYIFQCLGMYTIARRRGIHNPWLAWIPVGVNWILGSISDQYRYVARGQVKNRRKVLLGLNLVLLALDFASIVLLAVFSAGIVRDAGGMAAGEGSLPIAVAMLLISLVVLVIAVIVFVFQYMSLYDLFVSCNPEHGVLFLVLSMLFPIGAYLIFAMRNKDLGMPPPKPQPQAVFQTPVTEPAEAPAVEENLPETEE